MQQFVRELFVSRSNCMARAAPGRMEVNDYELVAGLGYDLIKV